MPDIGTWLTDVAARATQETDDKNITDRLVQITGKCVRVRSATSGIPSDKGTPGSTKVLVGRGRELPTGLEPMLILDASIRVKETYRLWEQQGQLVRLASATRDYSFLTVHLWPHGAGRSTIYKPGRYQQVLDALEEAIRANLSSRWLVVHHKKKQPGASRKDLMAELQCRLAGTSPHLDSTTWGMHCGTNQFLACNRVILVGLPYLSNSQYELLIYAASGEGPDRRDPSRQDIYKMRLGELQDNILQATCRTALRHGSGTPVHLYLMAAPKEGLRNALSELFPGCHVLNWLPASAAKPSKGGQKVLDYIARFFQGSPGGVLRFQDVQKALGIKSPPQFHAIRNQPVFKQKLNQLGVEETGGGSSRKNAFRQKPTSVSSKLAGGQVIPFSLRPRRITASGSVPASEHQQTLSELMERRR